MARKFFYICAGLFLLALSFHFGNSTATAQAPGNPVVAVTTSGINLFVALTANGDTYIMSPNNTGYAWFLESNVFSGGPTQTRQESWGQLKSRYAPNPGTATPGASAR